MHPVPLEVHLPALVSCTGYHRGSSLRSRKVPDPILTQARSATSSLFARVCPRPQRVPAKVREKERFDCRETRQERIPADRPSIASKKASNTHTYMYMKVYIYLFHSIRKEPSACSLPMSGSRRTGRASAASRAKAKSPGLTLYSSSSSSARGSTMTTRAPRRRALSM